jgi:hypothetical protein
MPKSSPPYDRLAIIWDQMHQDRHSVHMVDYCQKIFERFKIKPETGLDLCCGTGTAIKLLGDLGIRMSGVDMSAPTPATTSPGYGKTSSSPNAKRLPVMPPTSIYPEDDGIGSMRLIGNEDTRTMTSVPCLRRPAWISKASTTAILSANRARTLTASRSSPADRRSLYLSASETAEDL